MIYNTTTLSILMFMSGVLIGFAFLAVIIMMRNRKKEREESDSEVENTFKNAIETEK